jgi:hypothetical protein
MAAAAIPTWTGVQMMVFGLELLHVDEATRNRRYLSTNITTFKDHYGPHPYHAARVWQELCTSDTVQAKVPERFTTKRHVKYFLMALNFLKEYKRVRPLATTFSVNRETAGEWSWYFVYRISALKATTITWPGNWQGHIYIVSLDGTDFEIQEPTDPVMRKAKIWFSKKHDGPGVTYEIAMHLWEDRCVHAFYTGGSGAMNDMGAFRHPRGLKNKMPYGTKAIADKGYRGEEVDDGIISLHNSLDSDEVRTFKSRARARHENFNGRLKRYGVLEGTFRHHVDKHETCFNAVLVLCQYEMEGALEHRTILSDV